MGKYIRINEKHFPLGSSQSKLMNLPLCIMWLKTSSGVSSLNGGTPVRNSYKQTPSDHQSTAGAEKKNSKAFRLTTLGKFAFHLQSELVANLRN